MVLIFFTNLIFSSFVPWKSIPIENVPVSCIEQLMTLPSISVLLSSNSTNLNMTYSDWIFRNVAIWIPLILIFRIVPIIWFKKVLPDFGSKWEAESRISIRGHILSSFFGIQHLSGFSPESLSFRKDRYINQSVFACQPDSPAQDKNWQSALDHRHLITWTYPNYSKLHIPFGNPKIFHVRPIIHVGTLCKLWQSLQ